jgi:holo-[acyl-carrier protein] synthase
MIKGLGNDIIAIERIENVIERHGQRFLDRTFTSNEQEYCKRHKESVRHFAGRFAAKEAVVKALGTGFRDEVDFLEIEIINDDLGKPLVNVSPKITDLVGTVTISVSISHCKEYATAVAVVC